MCINKYFPMPEGVGRRRKFYKIFERNGLGKLSSFFRFGVIKEGEWLETSPETLSNPGFHSFVNLKNAIQAYNHFKGFNFTTVVLAEVHVKEKRKFGIEYWLGEKPAVLTSGYIKVVKILKEN